MSDSSKTQPKRGQKKNIVISSLAHRSTDTTKTNSSICLRCATSAKRTILNISPLSAPASAIIRVITATAAATIYKADKRTPAVKKGLVYSIIGLPSKVFRAHDRRLSRGECLEILDEAMGAKNSTDFVWLVPSRGGRKSDKARVPWSLELRNVIADALTLEHWEVSTMELVCTHFGKARLEPVKSGRFKADISGDVVNCFKLEFPGESLWFDEELIVNSASLPQLRMGDETLKRVPVRAQLEQIGFDVVGKGKKIDAIEKSRDVPMNKKNEFRGMFDLVNGYMAKKNTELLARNRHLRDERYMTEREHCDSNVNMNGNDADSTDDVNNVNDDANNVGDAVKEDGMCGGSGYRAGFGGIPEKKTKRGRPKKSADIRNAFFKKKRGIPEARSETYLDCSPASSSSSMPSSMSSASSTSSASSALTMSSASSARPSSHCLPGVPPAQWNPYGAECQQLAAGRGECEEMDGSSCCSHSGGRGDLASLGSDTLYDSDEMDGFERGGYDNEIFRSKEFREYYAENCGRGVPCEFMEHVMNSTPTVGSPTGYSFGLPEVRCCGVYCKKEDDGDDGGDNNGGGYNYNDEDGDDNEEEEDDDENDDGDEDEDDEEEVNDKKVDNDNDNCGGNGNDNGNDDDNGNNNGGDYGLYSIYDDSFGYYEMYTSDYDEIY